MAEPERRAEERRVVRGRRRDLLVMLGLGLAVSLAVVVLYRVDVLQPLERVVLNQEMRLRGSRPASEEVVIVEIDDRSIDANGRWPWPRGCIADLVSKLDDAGAKTIALDIVFSEPSRPCAATESEGTAASLSEDERLERAIENAPVVLGFFFRRQRADLAEEGEGGAVAEPTEPTAGAGPCAAPEVEPHESWDRSGNLKVNRGDPRISVRPAIERNLAAFEEAAKGRTGFFDHDRDEGVQQRYELVAKLSREVAGENPLVFPSLALAAVRHHQDFDEPVISTSGLRQSLWLGDKKVETDGNLELWIDYTGPALSATGFRKLSAIDVLNARDSELGDLGVDEKLVFVGLTEIGVGDLASTPFEEMWGVEVHANVADNLIEHRGVREDVLLSLTAVFAFGLLVPLLVAYVRRHLVGSLLAIAVVVAWPFVCYLVFASGGALQGLHLQVVAPMLAGVLALVASLRYQVGTVDARARQVKSLFQHYLSPVVIDELLAQEKVELRSELKPLTVLFCDIRGFTDMSEQLGDPQAVVDVLNQFFTPMTRIVLDRGGTLDKYMGDAMMAFFGAPVPQEDHAARACRAALAMRAELAALNERWRAEGKPAVGIGIGLNSGEMTVGNMGSEQVFDYTVIGDAVNLGSRVEGLNKVYGTEVLVTGDTRKAAGDGFLFRELDRVRVKGKTEAVVLHELMAAEPVPPEVRETAERFTAALAAYRERRFEEAEAAFAELAAAGDGPAKLYVERCARYRQQPPPDGWDGVETFTSK